MPIRTFLISFNQNDSDRIKIDGYNLITLDHPSDSKKGGVCVYYKKYISLYKRDDISTQDNCLVTKFAGKMKNTFYLFCTVHQAKTKMILKTFAQILTFFLVK